MCGGDDKIFTLEDKVMAEGQMLGTALPFGLLEKQEEETGGSIFTRKNFYRGNQPLFLKLSLAI